MHNEYHPRLDWDEDRIDHIAAHNVKIEEVLELHESEYLRVRHGKNKYFLFGQTASGRYLAVIVGKRRWSLKDWLVTARDMTPVERRYYKNCKG